MDLYIGFSITKESSLKTVSQVCRMLVALNNTVIMDKNMLALANNQATPDRCDSEHYGMCRHVWTSTTTPDTTKKVASELDDDGSGDSGDSGLQVDVESTPAFRTTTTTAAARTALPKNVLITGASVTVAATSISSATAASTVSTVNPEQKNATLDGSWNSSLSSNKNLGDSNLVDDTDAWNPENNDSDTTMVYSTVTGIVLGLLMVVLLVLVTVRRVRQRGLNAKKGGKKVSRLGDLPFMLKVHKDSTLFKDPIMYSNFNRCVAFDHMRHRRPLLELDDKTMLVTYDFLQLDKPASWDLPPLRMLCRQFLRKSVARDPDQYVNRAIDFISAALADVLLEEYLDTYIATDLAIKTHHRYSHLVRSITEDPCYEMPNDTVSPPLSPASGVYEPYDVSVLTPTHNRSSDHFYDVVDLIGAQPLYMEAFSYWKGGADRIYAEIHKLSEFARKGMNPYEHPNGESTYATIELPGGQSQYHVASNGQGTVYDVARARESALYDVAQNQEYDEVQPAYMSSSPLHPRYNVATHRHSSFETDATYSIAAANRLSAFDNGPVYALACSPSDPSQQSPAYDTAANVGAGNSTYDVASGDNNYDVAAANNPLGFTPRIGVPVNQRSVS